MKVNVNGQNYVIKWKHNNVDNESFNFNGITSCYIKVNGQVISSSEAFCSKKDNYDKSKGRKISLARALKNVDIDKNDRKTVWKNYFDEVNEGIKIWNILIVENIVGRITPVSGELDDVGFYKCEIE